MPEPAPTPESSNTNATYTKLLGLLDQQGAQYRLIDHPAEGRCEIVSPMRGHDVSHAAKCMIVKVKTGKKDRKFILAVVPGDAKINFDVLSNMFGGEARFADQENAERLAGSVAGTVLPFSFNEELTLIVDPSLKEHEFIYFNAARLDQSVELKTADYLRITNPRMERITGAEIKKKQDYF
ncbi:MAG: YbaK/prolyl-tRNA synthetase associated domain-containing protein [Proteobacteria bacterium]|nr:YbaK/prolyl-tRNA synthetase associated domain-containing protein [Pseudomonadota bacterium]